MQYPKVKRIVDKETLDYVFEKQGYCLIGGDCSGPECLHHIKTRGSGGGDVEGNLIRVCLRHHQMIHNGLISKEELYNLICPI